MLKAVLVDLDGTLIDTQEANARAYCRALDEFGYSIPIAKFIEISKGQSWKTFLPTLTGITHLQTLEPVVSRKRAVYENYLETTIMNTSLLQLLQVIRQSLRIALVTTASQLTVEPLLHYHHIQNFFHTIVTGDDVIKTKPDPEAYQLVASILGVSPSECVIFEDSESGIKAAQSFGATVFRV